MAFAGAEMTNTLEDLRYPELTHEEALTLQMNDLLPQWVPTSTGSTRHRIGHISRGRTVYLYQSKDQFNGVVTNELRVSYPSFGVPKNKWAQWTPDGQELHDNEAYIGLDRHEISRVLSEVPMIEKENH